MSFQSLNLIEPLLRSLQQEGYNTPTPIQQQAIPIILQGDDLLGCAQTGTGKTAAFTLPILQLLGERPMHDRRKGIRCLIVTPTRELAIQIGESIEAYGRFMPLKSTVIFGGVNQNPQADAVRRGVDILVATPGRLLDLADQGIVNLRNIEIFVLDEADRMLDMGFIHDVKRIIALLPRQRQSLFFSATMPPEIVKLAGTILQQPVKVEITPSATTVEIISQQVFMVDKENKTTLLLHLLKNPAMNQVLIFTRTKHGADRLAKALTKSHIVAEAIHGNKSQNARQRALNNFKNMETRVLVATDIAARGIDIEEMQWVVNYELPEVPETYVHRIGRTGRAGADGTAFSFCDALEKPLLRDIEKLIGQRIPTTDNHPFPLLDHNPVKKEKQQRGRSPRVTSPNHTGKPSSHQKKTSPQGSRPLSR
ncbi:MAG: DEAD/DEAH box helicase [Bacteroidales bacterium]|nr:DEAD/DEAH box helicase [Bacteroidales bacterium]